MLMVTSAETLCLCHQRVTGPAQVAGLAHRRFANSTLLDAILGECSGQAA